MVSRNLLQVALCFVLLMPMSAPQAVSSACSATSTPMVEGLYPDHSLSPLESLRLHELVLLGEVVVPARPCSLGFCAGVKVLRRIKGQPEANLLLRIATSRSEARQGCTPATLAGKGSVWLIFANAGTSRTGYSYYQVEDEGPSFPTREVPNFELLESHYRQLRARLDQAIRSRMEHLR